MICCFEGLSNLWAPLSCHPHSMQCNLHFARWMNCEIRCLCTCPPACIFLCVCQWAKDSTTEKTLRDLDHVHTKCLCPSSPLFSSRNIRRKKINTTVYVFHYSDTLTMNLSSHEYFQNLSKGSKEINVYSRMEFMCKRDVLIHVISKQTMWPSGARLTANACPNVSTGDSQRLKSVLCSACCCRLIQSYVAECTTRKLSLNGWQCLNHIIWPVIGHWSTIYHE